ASDKGGGFLGRCAGFAAPPIGAMTTAAGQRTNGPPMTTKPKFRIESDSMGEIAVPADSYWGAQTQRSLENFRIGGHRMPEALIPPFRLLERAPAEGKIPLRQPDRRARQGLRKDATDGPQG